jgi:hypothetical protein
MNENRKKLDKIIAVAVNPGAYEEEGYNGPAQGSRVGAREPFSCTSRAGRSASKVATCAGLLLPDANHEYFRATPTSDRDWPPAEAYGLGLKSKLELEFVEGAARYTLNARVDGPKLGCETFDRYVKWLIEFHNNYHVDGEQ